MATKIPEDWTNDPEALRVNDWKPGGDFEEVIEGFNIGEVRPIMCNGVDSDDFLFMFEAGDIFYIWDQIEHKIWRVTEPNTETKIIEVIDKPSVEGIGLVALA